MGFITDRMFRTAVFTDGQRLGNTGRLGDDLHVKRLPNGNIQIDTGRYLVETSEKEAGGKVRIFDKYTNTWTEADGDPHLRTGDGDKAGFTQNNLTVDLQDGTKITIDVTDAKNGVSWIENVSVLRGDEAVVVEGIRDANGGVGGEMRLTHTNDVQWADGLFDDGTVLRAGHEVDDLFFATGGQEIRGTDSTKRWGEHQLDGRGGVSNFRPVDGPSGSEPVSFSGMSVEEILYTLASMMDKRAQELGETVSNKLQADQQARSRFQGDYDKWKLNQDDARKGIAADDPDRQKKLDELDKTFPQPKLDDGNYSGVLDEGEKQRLLNELDKIQKLIQQLITTAANISKTHHDSNMAVINNMRP